MPRDSTMLSKLSTQIANFCTRPAVFAALSVIALIWLISGIFMGWSDLWNKIMDIPFTALSFLLYFVILSAQNTDTLGVHAKLDELIAATDGARDDLTHIEELSEEEIKEKRV